MSKFEGSAQDIAEFREFVRDSKKLSAKILDVISDTPTDIIIPAMIYSLGIVMQDFIEEGLFLNKEHALKHVIGGLESLLLDIEDAKEAKKSIIIN